MKSAFESIRTRLVEFVIMTLMFWVCWQLFHWPAFHYAFYISLFLCLFILVALAAVFALSLRQKKRP